MTYFLKSGTHFNVSTKAALDLHEHLPVGTYTVQYNKMAGAFYLEQIEGFSVEGKIYGDTKKVAKRILGTFKDRPNSTGVMLTGEKGTGKTLLAKIISLDAEEQGMPTIVINQPWAGEAFNGFMQMIEQPIVVIFDEFEKVYDKAAQEQMLTLLDGVYPSKKLFVITSNDTYRVNEHMRNRPGRIFYRKDYKGLDNAFIVEYCQDNLNNKSYIDGVTRAAMLFREFNFDILKAMVEEMNRYDETAQDVLQLLNAKPDSNDVSSFSVALSLNGTLIPEKNMDEEDLIWHGSPFYHEISLSFREGTRDESEEVDSRKWNYVNFTSANIVKIDPAQGRYTYADDEGYTATLTKIAPRQYTWTDAIA